ncbi:multicopper oxidase domain-containing protein [Streptomyces chiangmaiensis]
MMSLDLGGRSVRTWAYNEAVPGPLMRVTAGDVLNLTLANRRSAATTPRAHGVRLPSPQGRIGAAPGRPGLSRRRHQEISVGASAAAGAIRAGGPGRARATWSSLAGARVPAGRRAEAATGPLGPRGVLSGAPGPAQRDPTSSTSRPRSMP